MVKLSTIQLGYFAMLLLCILFPHPGSLEENLQFIKQHNPIIEKKEFELCVGRYQAKSPK